MRNIVRRLSRSPNAIRQRTRRNRRQDRGSHLANVHVPVSSRIVCRSRHARLGSYRSHSSKLPDQNYPHYIAGTGRRLKRHCITARRKRAVEAAQTAADYAGYLEMEADLQGYAGHDPDYTEGVLAFLEKRAPKWRGLV